MAATQTAPNRAARAAVVEYYMANPQRVYRRDDLYRLAVALSGVHIPYQPVCRDHQTPFDYLSAMVIDNTGDDVLVTACRGGGKTWTTSLANAIDLNFLPGVEIASVGAIDKQAKRCYKYTKELLEFPVISDRIRRSVMEMTEVRDPAWERSSTYEQLVGTLNGVNSPHPQKLRCDEVDLMSWDILKELMMVPQSKNGIRAAMSMVSSIKFADGNMAHLADDVDMNLKKITWCYKEVSEPCTVERRGHRRADYVVNDIENPDKKIKVSAYNKCGKCPLLPTCRGDLVYATGWILIDDSIKEFMKLDRDTWLSQKECRRPTKRAMIYPDWWDDAPHVITDFQPPEDKGIYFRAWDHTGGGDSPTVCGFWWVSPEGDYYLFDEYVASGMLIEDYAKAVTSRWSRPFVRDYSDPAAAQEAKEYRRYGVMLSPAYNDHEVGFRMVRALEQLQQTGKPRKFVCKRCKNYRYEKARYKRAVRDGVVTDAIDPKCRKYHDHSMDMERYAISSFMREMERTDSKRRPSRPRPSRKRRSKAMRNLHSVKNVAGIGV